MTREKIGSPEALNSLAGRLKERAGGRKMVSVCLGTGCRAEGSGEVYEAIREAVGELGLEDEVIVMGSGCHGLCALGPLVILTPDDIFYPKVSPEDATEIIEKSVIGSQPVDRLLYKTGGKTCRCQSEVPFYGRQERIVLGLNGIVDPHMIEDYIREGGYQSLAEVLYKYPPEDVVSEISASGLRGRGGGGFPTGRKWESCRAVETEDGKFVICNADEGDPGAFMDRSIMEANPHTVIEGMVIGAYAVGAEEGYIYIRKEYPLALNTLQCALEQARDYGLLGHDILGSGRDFEINVARGGGAFVCGESTALTASIEGRVGEPGAKHIHTTESGLWGRPTVLNNVETWANVPEIIKRGSRWFASIGSEGSKGTKVFSLVGAIKNTGLIEVPMGITLREIIEDIGGGMAGNHGFKAVQTGGPSGGCIPADHLDMKVDFDSLIEVGSMMGSGGMIVMDESSCMVDVARYFLDFLRTESCGKCTPCRDGTEQMFMILDRICRGKAGEDELGKLEEIAELVRETSLCKLGSSAPNPVLSTLRFFRDEYEAHIRDKKCPAGVCSALIEFSIDQEKCVCCGRCANECPVDCIAGTAGKPPAKASEEDHQEGKVGEPFLIDVQECVKCGSCFDVCPTDAVEKK